LASPDPRIDVPIEAGAVRLSPLDTARFGIRTARVDDVDERRLPETIEFCQSNSIELLIARCAVDRLATLASLNEAAFSLMDTLVYYERELVDLDPKPSPDHEIEDLDPDDAAQIEVIARTCFRDYPGHYHADPRLGRDACAEAYADWARTSCGLTEPAGFMLVAGARGRRLGFAAFEKRAGGSAELTLGAVLPEGRGKGLYRRLTIAGMTRLKAHGVRTFRASTHIANWSSQASWIGAGLRPREAYYTFHRWFSSSGVGPDRRQRLGGSAPR
jgi:ribosomal protein S18 acetylase RimI-like enzyme